MLQGKICIGILFLCVNLHAQDEQRRYDSPDNWQAASDNYWVCARLKGDSAKTRYADGTPVSDSSAYDVTSAVNSDQCGPGWIRLDHREILKVRNEDGEVVRRLVWHKGGQDYPVFRYSRAKPPFFEGVTLVSPFIFRGTWFKTACSADLAR